MTSFIFYKASSKTALTSTSKQVFKIHTGQMGTLICQLTMSNHHHLPNSITDAVLNENVRIFEKLLSSYARIFSQRTFLSIIKFVV